ncbi:MAG: sigma-E processing peptidase SpoIIGA [Oscillospiraceae bacterium]|nr:sigma-E processing peptidase SpoIIGA [Oscillospiraceae bacterium]
MKTIYIDVLIILNIYVNFFLLKATARLTHTPLKTSRCVVSSVIGSLFSLTIFLPDMNFLIPLAIKLGAAVIITALAFGIKDKRQALKLVFFFYLVNFIFGGIIMLFYLTFRPGFMAFGNTYFYVDFSLLSLVVFTAVSYFAVTAVRRLMDRGCDTKGKYKVVIRQSGKTVSVDALADTGNSLVDMFSGKPVIICRSADLQDIADLPSEPAVENAELLYKTNGLRFIPYSTIGNTGMIAVFSPEEIVICDSESGRTKKVDAMIGIDAKDVPAVFNPKLLL